MRKKYTDEKKREDSCSFSYIECSRQLMTIDVTTVFVDMQLWKTKHPRKRFQNFRRVIDRSDRNPPMTATGVTF